MAVTRHLGLGVIETRWFDEHHHTVRPLFEFLSYALKNRPDAFTYERFVGATSFREAVRFMTGSGDVDYLYIAAHGDFGKIEAPDGSGPVADLPQEHDLRREPRAAAGSRACSSAPASSAMRGT